MGVVVRRYNYRYSHNNYFPYSTSICSFFDSSIPISLFIFKMFFFVLFIIKQEFLLAIESQNHSMIIIGLHYMLVAFFY